MRPDIAMGPSAHRGVTTLMSVGADDVVAVTPLESYARKGTWISAGVWALGMLSGSGTLKSIGFGGAVALAAVRFLAR